MVPESVVEDDWEDLLGWYSEGADVILECGLENPEVGESCQ